MLRIAMLSCLKANTVCAGVACLEAYNNRTKAFERYGKEEVTLVAFLRCNGCGENPLEDVGMQEKIARLVKVGTQVVHLGICTKMQDKTTCPTVQAIAVALAQKGIAIVTGTH